MDSELDSTLHARTRARTPGRRRRRGTPRHRPGCRRCASAGIDVAGPLGRGEALPPDADVGDARACPTRRSPSPRRPSPRDRPDLLVGHCSAATTLEPLGVADAFSLHPLMTITDDGATFAGATAAIAGSTPRALALAETLAEALGMRPVHVADEDRAAYHAAASIASNFLVTLEGVAERLAATAGVDREPLVALVRASVENWAAAGAAAALTGPIARGDEQTVQRQRDAVAERLSGGARAVRRADGRHAPAGRPARLATA